MPTNPSEAIKSTFKRQLIFWLNKDIFSNMVDSSSNTAVFLLTTLFFLTNYECMAQKHLESTLEKSGRTATTMDMFPPIGSQLYFFVPRRAYFFTNYKNLETYLKDINSINLMLNDGRAVILEHNHKLKALNDILGQYGKVFDSHLGEGYVFFLPAF